MKTVTKNTRIYNERMWWKLFEFGLLVKVIKGLLETITGSIMLLARHAALQAFITTTLINTKNNLPESGILTFIAKYLEKLSSHAATFIGSYLIVHGLLHIFLSASIYRNKLWAYPLMLLVTGIFAAYLIQRSIIGNTFILLPVFMFDLCFMLLTLHEYELHRGRLGKI